MELRTPHCRTNADSVNSRSKGAVKSGLGEFDFWVRLSEEHVAATFVKDLNDCAEKVMLHSKGYNSRALMDLATSLPLLSQ